MNKLKKAIVAFLRKAKLLQAVDSIMLVKSILTNRKANKKFLESHPDFVPPPYALAYDAYNHTNWKAYHDMGVIHANFVSELIRKHIKKNEISICEWGCGPARVIRHLQTIEGFQKIELYGTDYNKASINWCENHINNINFSTNNLAPPLPFKSDQFDCLYAISIFTHLSEENHYKWINELFRVIKPDGIVIFTTHGDLCAERLLPEEKAKYDSGVMVVKDRIKEGKKHFSSYQPHGFVREKLLKDRLVLQHIVNPKPYLLEQEVWVVKKR